MAEDILLPYYNILSVPLNEILDWNCGIYVIYCIPNGKFYIGSSKELRKRLYTHELDLKRNRHLNSYLQRTYNKYGADNFQFLIIELCKEQDLICREQWWLDITHCYMQTIGFNGRPTANNNSGYVWNDEQRANLSRAKKGFYHTEEAKAKMRIKKPLMSERMKGNQYNKGRIYTGQERKRVALQARKFDKWPHEKGSLCRCEECKAKLRARERERRALSRSKKNV